MSEGFSARLSLLDQQLVDADRLPVGRIDDVELATPPRPGARPQIVALLVGTQALGERLNGRLGAALATASARLRAPADAPGPARIDAALIAQIGAVVRLRVRFDDLRSVAPLERWLADHFVGNLPGAHRETE